MGDVFLSMGYAKQVEDLTATSARRSGLLLLARKPAQ